MKIHERIRKIREQKGLKLIELYRRIKEHFGHKAINYRTLKRIQAGETEPTEFSLYRISIGLGIKLKDLMAEEKDSPVKFIPKDKPEGHYDYAPAKAHADKLATRKLKGMLPQKLFLAPKAKTRVEITPEAEGEKTYQKWVYNLKGETVCVVEGKRYVLKRGDACFFDSHHSHYFENTSSKHACCLVIQCPPYI